MTKKKVLQANAVEPAPVEEQQTVPIKVFSEVVNRALLASKVGTQTYSGARNVYQALGYPEGELDYQNYYAPRYKRQDIAKAVIDRPVKASWKGQIKLMERSGNTTTTFEQSWIDLNDEFPIKNILMRSDKLTGLGRYSVLLFGMSDISSNDGYSKPVKKGAKLVFLKPLSEQTATIAQFDSDVKSKRFGLPVFYDVTAVSKDINVSQSIRVHYTRMLHIVEDIMENEVYGTPRLEAVFNRLLDLEKLVGGDAEMFWRGARPGYTGEVDKDYEMDETAEAALKDQISEFENNLRRILVNSGVKYKALDQQIADPSSHVDVQVQMISAVTGIPKRILVGSERGELSSAQDKQEWISYVSSRREEQNEPMILRPFVDKCIELGILEKPATPYVVIWDKLFSLSDKEKADVGKVRAESIKEFTTNPIALELLPMRSLMEHILGFDNVQTDDIISEQGTHSLDITDEEDDEEDITKEEVELPKPKVVRKRTK